MRKAPEVQNGGGVLPPQAKACLALAALLGLLGLGGNLLGLPRLAGLGMATAAMSLPSALVLGLLTGGLALGRGRWPWLGRACLGLAMALAVLSCLPWAGTGLQALLGGYWGARPSSPLRAAVIMAQALALLAATSAPLPGRGARQAAAGLALLPVGIGVVTLIGTLAGGDQLYPQHLQPMPLASALAFGALGFATLLAAGDDTWPMALFRPAVAGDRWTASGSLRVFLAASAVILVTGALLLHGQLTAARDRALGELTAIAGVKAATLTSWYRDRDQDARQILQGPHIQRLLQGGLHGPASGELQAWLDAARVGAYRRVLLFDAAGALRAASPAGTPIALSPATRAGLQLALRAGTVQVQDLHRDGTSGEPLMGWWIPVGAPAAPGQPSPGALLLELDPRQFLYPILQAWPVAGTSAETMLGRREGGEVVFLNDLRHYPGAALNLRLPVAANGGLPGQFAALGGDGLVRGRDYRGVQVLASLTRLTGTPWALVVKVDEAEIYGSLRLAVWIAGTLVLAALGAMALLFGLLVRQRDAGHFATRIQLEQDKRTLADRYAHLMEQASDAILVVDLAGRILEVNLAACQLYGRSAESLRALTLMDLRVPEEQGEFPAQFSQVRSGASVRYETRHRRADGTEMPVEITAREVLFGDMATILAFVRDCSARKAQEA